ASVKSSPQAADRAMQSGPGMGWRCKADVVLERHRRKRSRLKAAAGIFSRHRIGSEPIDTGSTCFLPETERRRMTPKPQLTATGMDLSDEFNKSRALRYRNRAFAIPRADLFPIERIPAPVL